MRIVYIAAGAGGMYCGACARDIALVRALIARGHDVQVLPLYTPLRRDGVEPPLSPRIFLGGINVYLQQVSSFFRHTPDAVDRLLDNPALLRWVSQFSISTDPAKLGPMTISVLSGTAGHQQKEYRKLLDHLALLQPEIVVVTNSMLSAIAPAVKARLGVPVVCLLQGEEEFIHGLGEPFTQQAIDLIRAHAAAVDLFVASYDAYVDAMTDFLAVPKERITVVRAGLEMSLQPLAPRRYEPFTAGYLSVITPGKGLDLLVSAAKRLRDEGREIRLLIAGKPLHPQFWRTVQSELADAGLVYEYRGEVDYAGKQAFLRQCSVFTVPSRFREARGMAMMEAQSAGVPVIAPDSGVFSEMLALTGGGLLVPPGDATALARAMARLQDDPDGADRLGRAGAEGIARHYSAPRIAEHVQEIFTNLLAPAEAEVTEGDCLTFCPTCDGI